MKMVYLLWCSDGHKPYIEGVYAQKIDAERDMRELKEFDATHRTPNAYLYSIQEKELK